MSFQNHIGYSGSRGGMTDKQKVMLYDCLKTEFTFGENFFHHGDCVGGDAEAHDMAKEIGYLIVIHPPLDEKMRAFKPAYEMKARMPFKLRNRRIVQASRKIFCAPKSLTSKKGGTWNAIEWCIHYGKEHLILSPN